VNSPTDDFPEGTVMRFSADATAPPAQVWNRTVVVPEAAGNLTFQ